MSDEESFSEVRVSPSDDPDTDPNPATIKQTLTFDQDMEEDGVTGGESQAGFMNVFLRIKPIVASTVTSNGIQSPMTKESDTCLTVQAPTESHAYRTGNNRESQRFFFTHVFGPETSQKEVFNTTVSQPIESFLQGENRLLFAYGVTNSGKTYTVHGEAGEEGLVPRGLEMVFSSLRGHLYPGMGYKPKRFNEVERLTTSQEQAERKFRDQLLRISQTEESDCSMLTADTTAASLFSAASEESLISDTSTISTCSKTSEQLQLDRAQSDAKLSDGPIRYMVWISMAEIYNEQVFDLLEISKKEGAQRPRLHLREDGNGGVYVKGLREACVHTAEEAYRMLLVGRKNLQIAATKLNSTSSRSHCIFTIKLVRISDLDGGVPVGLNMLSFCDLAGAERSSKTGSEGERVREAGNINTSLLTLGQCMRIMRENQGRLARMVVPFRGSKLTMMLRGFLTGHGQAAMIVNISQNPTVFDETLQVLRYSAIAKEVLVAKEEKAPTSVFKKPTLPRTVFAWTPGYGSVESRVRQLLGTISNCDDTNYDAMELLSVIQALYDKYKDEKTSNQRLEISIRAEVSKEVGEAFAEMEKSYEDRIRLIEERAEEEADTRIALLTESTKKLANKRKRIEEASGDGLQQREEQRQRIASLEKEVESLRESRRQKDEQLDQLMKQKTQVQIKCSRLSVEHAVNADMDTSLVGDEEVQGLREKVSKLQQELEEKKEEVEELQMKAVKTRQSLSGITSAKSNSEVQTTVWEDQYTQTQDEISKLQLEKESYREQIEKMEHDHSLRIRQFKREMDQLKSLVSQEQSEKEETSRASRSMERQVKEEKQRRKAAEAKCDELQEVVEDLQSCLCSSKERLDHAEMEVDRLQAENSQMQTRCEEMSGSYEDYANQTDKMESLEKRLQEARREVEAKEEELDKAYFMCSDLRAELARGQEMFDTKLDEMQGELAERVATIEDMKIQLDGGSNSMHAHNRELENLQKAHNQQRVLISKLQGEKRALEAEAGSLEEKVTKLEAELEKLREEKEAERRELVCSSAELRQAEKERLEQRNCEDMAELRRTLQEEKEQLRQTLQEEKLQTLAKLVEEKEVLEAESGSLREKLAVREGEVKRLQEEKDEEVAETIRAQNKLRQVEKEVGEWQQSSREYQEKLEAETVTVIELENKLAAVKENLEQRDVRAAEMAETAKTLAQSERERQELVKEIEELTEEHKKKEEKWYKEQEKLIKAFEEKNKATEAIMKENEEMLESQRRKMVELDGELMQITRIFESFSTQSDAQVSGSSQGEVIQSRGEVIRSKLTAVCEMAKATSSKLVALQKWLVSFFGVGESLQESSREVVEAAEDTEDVHVLLENCASCVGSVVKLLESHASASRTTRERVIALEEQRAEMEQRLVKQGEELEAERQVVAELRKDAQVSAQEVEEVKKKLRKKEDELETKAKQLKEEQTCAQDNEKEFNSLIKKNQELREFTQKREQEISCLRQVQGHLSNKAKELEDAMLQLQQVKLELDQVQNQKKDSEKEIVEYKSQVSSLEVKLRTSEREVEEKVRLLDVKTKKLQEVLDSAQSERNRSEIATRDAIHNQRVVQTMQQALVEQEELVESQNTLLKDREEIIKGLNLDLDNQVKENEREREKLQNKYEAQLAEVKTLKQSLHEACAEMNKMTRDLAASRNKVESLEKQGADVRMEMDGLTRDLAASRSKAESLEKQAVKQQAAQEQAAAGNLEMIRRKFKVIEEENADLKKEREGLCRKVQDLEEFRKQYHALNDLLQQNEEEKRLLREQLDQAERKRAEEIKVKTAEIERLTREVETKGQGLNLSSVYPSTLSSKQTEGKLATTKKRKTSGYSDHVDNSAIPEINERILAVKQETEKEKEIQCDLEDSPSPPKPPTRKTRNTRAPKVATVELMEPILTRTRRRTTRSSVTSADENSLPCDLSATPSASTPIKTPVASEPQSLPKKKKGKKQLKKIVENEMFSEEPEESVSCWPFFRRRSRMELPETESIPRIVTRQLRSKLK